VTLAAAVHGAEWIGAVVLLAGCGGDDTSRPPAPEARIINVSSPAFPDAGTIPKRFTCSGEDVSPPLEWSKLPGRTRELALLVEDVDADGFAHWIVLGMAPTVDHFAEGSAPPGSSAIPSPAALARYMAWSAVGDPRGTQGVTAEEATT
jgi:hypothetical protein